MELCEGGEVDEGDAEGWMGLRVERDVCEQGTWGGRWCCSGEGQGVVVGIIKSLLI